MPNIIIGPLPLPIAQPLLWLLKKLVEHLPAIVLLRALALLDQVTDPKTAPWKRAAIAAALIELVALVNASVLGVQRGAQLPLVGLGEAQL